MLFMFFLFRREFFVVQWLFYTGANDVISSFSFHKYIKQFFFFNRKEMKDVDITDL